jgi:threonyl-tRNA synthetase
VHDYAQKVADQLAQSGIRAEFDSRNEKIGYKIREWELKKVPYMLVVGEKEKLNGTVAVRQHRKGDIGALPVDEIGMKIQHEINHKLLTS